MIITLETKRLILRPWKEEDAENLYELAKDERVGPSAGWPPHKSVSESKEIIKSRFFEDITFAVCKKETGEIMGCIGISLGKNSDLCASVEEAEIGYWIGFPYWGNGYIPEAAAELIRYCFEELKLQKIWCRYFDGNEKSKRVQEKCGFVYYRTVHGVPCNLLGELKTEHISQLTLNEWRKTHEKQN